MLKHLGIAGKRLVADAVGTACSGSRTSPARVLDKANTASGAGRLQDETELAVRVSGFVHEFQKERGLTALFLGSAGAKYGTELETSARRPTGARALRKLAAAAGAAAQRCQRRSSRSLARRSSQRVDAQSIPPADATGYYTKVNAAMLDVINTVAPTPASRS